MEPQINQQVVVEEVPDGQEHSDRDKYDALYVLVVLVELLRYFVDEPGPTADHEDCPREEEQKLRKLHEVEKPKRRLPHLSFSRVLFEFIFIIYNESGKQREID